MPTWCWYGTELLFIGDLIVVDNYATDLLPLRHCLQWLERNPDSVWLLVQYDFVITDAFTFPLFTYIDTIVLVYSVPLIPLLLLLPLWYSGPLSVPCMGCCSFGEFLLITGTDGGPAPVLECGGGVRHWAGSTTPLGAFVPCSFVACVMEISCRYRCSDCLLRYVTCRRWFAVFTIIGGIFVTVNALLLPFVDSPLMEFGLTLYRAGLFTTVIFFTDTGVVVWWALLICYGYVHSPDDLTLPSCCAWFGRCLVTVHYRCLFGWCRWYSCWYSGRCYHLLGVRYSSCYYLDSPLLFDSLLFHSRLWPSVWYVIYRCSRWCDRRTPPRRWFCSAGSFGVGVAIPFDLFGTLCGITLRCRYRWTITYYVYDCYYRCSDVGVCTVDGGATFVICIFPTVMCHLIWTR